METHSFPISVSSISVWVKLPTLKECMFNCKSSVTCYKNNSLTQKRCARYCNNRAIVTVSSSIIRMTIKYNLKNKIKRSPTQQNNFFHKFVVHTLSVTVQWLKRRRNVQISKLVTQAFKCLKTRLKHSVARITLSINSCSALKVYTIRTT